MMRQAGALCCQASCNLFVYWELLFKGMSALYFDSTPPTVERRRSVGAGVKCAPVSESSPRASPRPP